MKMPRQKQKEKLGPRVQCVVVIMRTETWVVPSTAFAKTEHIFEI